MISVGVGWILLLGVCLVQGGFTDMSKYELPLGKVLYQRFGAYDRVDSPFGGSEAFMRYNITFTMSSLVNYIGDDFSYGEILVFHYLMKPHVGMVDPYFKRTVYCCSRDLFQLGLCKKENALIFNASLDRSDIYYRALNFSQYQSGTAFLDEFALLKHTGIWYIYLANCGSDAGSGVSLFLNGKIEWKNPYGYLPGQILGFLPLYWLMAFFYFFMAVAWVVLSVKYRKDIMDLQHGIGIVIFISLIENLTWAGDYTNYNIKGINSDVVNVFGALFSSAKLTLVRTLVLVVAIGYTITRPELTMRYKGLIVLLTVLYFITVTTSQYITVSETAGNNVPMEFQVATTIFLIIFNVTFFVWIGVEMLGTVRNLKNNENLKLTMYKRLAVLLILSILLSVTIVVLQIMIQITDTSDIYFRVWWLWEGYWEFIYFACIAFVAWVWRPSDHNSRYAYEKIGMDDNQEVEMDVGLEENGDENGEKKEKEKSSSSSLSGLEEGDEKEKEPNGNLNDSDSDLSD